MPLHNECLTRTAGAVCRGWLSPYASSLGFQFFRPSGRPRLRLPTRTGCHPRVSTLGGRAPQAVVLPASHAAPQVTVSWPLSAFGWAVAAFPREYRPRVRRVLTAAGHPCSCTSLIPGHHGTWPVPE